MAIPRACVVSIVTGILAFGASISAAEGRARRALGTKARASQYLDGRMRSRFKFDSARRGEGASAVSCVSCHTLLSYAARETRAQAGLRRQGADRDGDEGTRAGEEQGRKLGQARHRSISRSFMTSTSRRRNSRAGTEAILNALVLSLDDASHARKEPTPIQESSFRFSGRRRSTKGSTRARGIGSILGWSRGSRRVGDSSAPPWRRSLSARRGKTAIRSPTAIRENGWNLSVIT